MKKRIGPNEGGFNHDVSDDVMNLLDEEPHTLDELCDKLGEVRRIVRLAINKLWSEGKILNRKNKYEVAE